MNVKRKSKITMKKLKKDVQGITLIALVVTIIVLLILAGVALNLTIGKNGIFARATKTSEEARYATLQEEITSLNNLYYLNTLNIKAVNNQDYEEQSIMGISQNFNNLAEFLNWLKSSVQNP